MDNETVRQESSTISAQNDAVRGQNDLAIASYEKSLAIMQQLKLPEQNEIEQRIITLKGKMV